MARRAARPRPARAIDLTAPPRACPECGGPLRAAYEARRAAITLDGAARSGLQVRRRRDRRCPRFGTPRRPGREGRLALPQHGFGLDVVAAIGRLRHAEHRSRPETHAELTRRGVPICARSVGNPPGRYDELLALSHSDVARLRRLTAAAGRAIPALDGHRPDVGHEALWVLRDALSGEVLPAPGLPSSGRDDPARFIGEVRSALEVPVAGVISDGQHSIRKAGAAALPGVPRQLCQSHYLREARPTYEADRHAKVLLEMEVRGIRPIGRRLEGRDAPEAGAGRGCCAAARSALADGGRPPPEAPGLKLQGRPSAIAGSLDRVARKGGCRGS